MIDARGSLTTSLRPVLAAILVLLPALSEDAGAADFDETVKTARQHLECSDREERAALSQKLGEYTDDWRDVVEALRPRPTRAAKQFPIPESVADAQSGIKSPISHSLVSEGFTH